MNVLISDLLDEELCYKFVRSLKWKNGVECYDCGSTDIRKNGRDKEEPSRQRYICKSCNKSFTDVSNTALSAKHIPVKKWLACFLLKDHMSNRQMAKALGLPEKIVGEMRMKLLDGLIKDDYIKNYRFA